MNWKFELHGDRKTRAKASFWVRSGSTVVHYNFRCLLVIISSCLSINSHCQDGRRNPKLTLRVVEGVLEQVKGRSASVASYKRPTDFPGFHDYWGKGKKKWKASKSIIWCLEFMEILSTFIVSQSRKSVIRSEKKVKYWDFIREKCLKECYLLQWKNGRVAL